MKLTACLLWTALAAAANPLKISEFACVSNRGIVEIYNCSESTQSLAGIRLESGKGTDPGIFCLLTSNDGILRSAPEIPPFGYFLIVNSSLSQSIDADFIITNNAGGRGVLALEDSLYLARGPVSSADDSDIIDLAGFGNSCIYFEGSAAAQALSNSCSLERKAKLLSDSASMQSGADVFCGNAFDFNDNRLDFILRTQPDWQKSTAQAETADFTEVRARLEPGEISAPVVLSPGERRTNQTLWNLKLCAGAQPLSTEYLIIKFLKPPQVPENVQIITEGAGAAIGQFCSNSADSSFYKFQVNLFLFSNQTAEITLCADISMTNTADILSLEIDGAWGASVPALTSLKLIKSKAAVCRDKILIAEVKTSGSSADDEYVMLYNPNARSVTLSNWKLMYQSSTGSESEKARLHIVMPAYSSYLIGGRGYASAVLPDVVKTLDLSSAAEGFALILKDSASLTSDRAAFGSSEMIIAEGLKQSAIGSALCAVRLACDASSPRGRGAFLGNGFDSGDNSIDFLNQQNCRPRNRFSSPQPLGDAVITSIEGLSSETGGRICFYGSNLMEKIDEAAVLLNGTWFDAEKLVWNSTEISFEVTKNFESGGVFTLTLPSLSNQSQLLPMGVFNFQMPQFSNLSPSVLMRGQKMKVNGRFFGKYQPDCFDFIAGGVLIEPGKLLWSSNQIELLAPWKTPFSAGSTICISNRQSGEFCSIAAESFTNAPPVSGSELVSFSPDEGGLNTYFSLQVLFVDPDGDAVDGLPKIEFFTEDNQSAGIFETENAGSNLYEVSFTGAIIHGIGAVRFETIMKSAAGNTNISRISKTISLLIDRQPPPAPSFFYAQTLDDGVMLYWTRPQCSDFSNYLLELGNTSRNLDSEEYFISAQDLSSITTAALYSRDVHGNLSEAAEIEISVVASEESYLRIVQGEIFWLKDVYKNLLFSASNEKIYLDVDSGSARCDSAKLACGLYFYFVPDSHGRLAIRRLEVLP